MIWCAVLRLWCGNYHFTDIARDGALSGVNAQATSVASAVSIPIIASGGVRGIEDISAWLTAHGLEGLVLDAPSVVGGLTSSGPRSGEMCAMLSACYPLLDVHDGRVVKGVNFVDLVDAGDPLSRREFMMQLVLMSCVF